MSEDIEEKVAEKEQAVPYEEYEESSEEDAEKYVYNSRDYTEDSVATCNRLLKEPAICCDRTFSITSTVVPDHYSHCKATKSLKRKFLMKTMFQTNLLKILMSPSS
jgi:hypothetical protein